MLGKSVAVTAVGSVLTRVSQRRERAWNRRSSPHVESHARAFVASMLRTHEDKIERCVVCVGDLDDRKDSNRTSATTSWHETVVHDSRGRRGRRRGICGN